MTWSNSRRVRYGSATLRRPRSAALASDLDRTVPELARIVGQREAEANAIPELLAALTEQIDAWRRL